MFAKLSLGLVLAVSLVAAASVSLTPNAAALEGRAKANVSHNLIVGSRVPYDYLLTQQVSQTESLPRERAGKRERERETEGARSPRIRIF